MTPLAVSPPPLPFHLLELTIISGQDLLPTTLPLYAVAWAADPNHKLTTHLSGVRGSNPSWNERFVFRVDNSFLASDTTTITIHILAFHRRLRFLRRDPVVGTVRVVVSSICPGPTTRFVALQVRRPSSLRPQGILNLGFSLLDAALPLYYNVGSSFGAFKERPGSRGEGEMEVLESTLERWRMDLLRCHCDKEMVLDQATGTKCDEDVRTRRRRKRSRAFSCFCGGLKMENTVAANTQIAPAIASA